MEKVGEFGFFGLEFLFELRAPVWLAQWLSLRLAPERRQKNFAAETLSRREKIFLHFGNENVRVPALELSVNKRRRLSHAEHGQGKIYFEHTKIAIIQIISL